MKPDAQSCLGMTLPELEAEMIVKGYPASTDFTQALNALIALGTVKQCSQHPGRYLMTRGAKLFKKRPEKALEPGQCLRDRAADAGIL